MLPTPHAPATIDDVRERAPMILGGGIDYGLLAELSGFSIKLVWILGYSLLQKYVGDSAITPLRFSMLELVGTNPGHQQGLLGNALGLSRPAATLAIDFWQERGCVERRTDPNDRRSFAIFPTSHGLAELARLRDLVQQADDALIRGLDPAEVVELRRLLGKIHL